MYVSSAISPKAAQKPPADLSTALAAFVGSKRRVVLPSLAGNLPNGLGRCEGSNIEMREELFMRLSSNRARGKGLKLERAGLEQG